MSINTKNHKFQIIHTKSPYYDRGKVMEKSDRQRFQNRLQELMKENNEMIPIELARVTQCDYHAVSNWLNGTFLPRYPSLLALRNYFKVSFDFLLGLTDEENYVNSSPHVSFSARLESLLNQRQLTKYALAKHLNVGQPTVSRWFLNGNIPETTTLIKLSRFFDISIEYLTGFIN